jgi:hypothetical protein
MSEIYQVTIQVRAPSGRPGDMGQVAFGHYVIEDGVLFMTDSEGKKVRRRDGDLMQKKLQPADNPEIIARNFTRELRSHFRDASADFNRPLVYPPLNVA